MKYLWRLTAYPVYANQEANASFMGTPTESRQSEVREELHRLLDSPVFRSSKRCREFLQHIVERTLSGPNGSLKERSIGIELFGLPHDFDSSQHTIVRVTASETRKKLAQYYQAGNGHPVLRIDLPSGSYNAEFYWPEEAPEPTQATPADTSEQLEVLIPPDLVDPPSVVPPQHRRSLILGGAVSLAALTGFSAWKLRSTPPETLPNTSRVTLPPAQPSTTVASARIGVGLNAPYFDRNGQTWEADRYFSGGAVRARHSERIVRTLDPDLYRRPRIGDFRYDIPLAPGNYELHLHFAETGLSDFISAESSGEGQRLFRVSANGKTLLDYFDVVADAAGTNTADERIFRNLTPDQDGFLHLAFAPLRGTAMVSGIEVLPMTARGKVTPLRIRSGWGAGWRDANNNQWRADSYFLGGNALVRRTNPARESEPDNALYSSERWGHFTYALPVAEGRYRLKLLFCEGHLGPRNSGIGGVGSRIFDVHCNGTTLMKDFDIVREAKGEGRPLDQVFSGLRPNAQGKFLLTFVPTEGMACVNGIEVAEL